MVSGSLTQKPYVVERLCGRDVQVETSTEIVAKKVWYRGVEFTARDLFDLAVVAEREPEALAEIKPILHDRREVILARIAKHEEAFPESRPVVKRSTLASVGIRYGLPSPLSPPGSLNTFSAIFCQRTPRHGSTKR